MYDVIVIGAGPAGYVAAIRSAQLGLKTACIEKYPTLGGTCLNVGCIPSKALLHTSEWYWKIAKEGKELGLNAPEFTYDWKVMQERKNKIVKELTKGIEGLFKKNRVDRFIGQARFKDPFTIEVGSDILQGKSIVLATGSKPIALPFLPFDEKKIVSSTGALALESVPKKLLIVGAGVIGVELGSIYKRLGSEVVFIEFLDRICPGFDGEVSKHLLKILTAQQMQFYLSHKVSSAQGTVLNVQGEGKEFKIEGDVVLVAVGRRPYTEGLDLEKAGIEKTPKGSIPVDLSFRTKQPHIFAIGDLIEGPMLAHKASEEGIAVAELLGGLRPSVDYLSIPSVAYTQPEVASVGLTEEEIKTRNIAYKIGRFPFKANSKARTSGEEEGFVKVLADSSSRRVLGIHIIGSHASEMIAEGTLALQMKAKVEDLSHTCNAHPTLSEALKEASLSVFGAPIHL